jgi:hypothetical protein
MSSHTPGPWPVPHFATGHGCDCRYILAGEHMGGIAEVYVDNGKKVSDGGNDCPPIEEAKANARLIAAAPELLAALKRIVAEVDRPQTGAPVVGGVLRAIAESRDAIAKAEGKS